jgi:hypothetical protein
MGQEWLTALGQLGFPIVVAAYLLWQQSKQMERLTRALGDVKIGLALLLSKMNAIEEFDKLIESKKKEE